MKKCVCCLFLCWAVAGGKMPAAVTGGFAAFPWQTEQVKEVPNPEKEARKLTDEMDELLQLTEKQYKKVYKLNLKEEKEKVERMTGKNPFGGGRPPMFPMGGMPPMGGFPPEGKRRLPMPDNMQEDMQNRIEKRNKKLKKILTDEQYEKWMSRKPEQENPAMPLPSMMSE